MNHYYSVLVFILVIGSVTAAINSCSSNCGFDVTAPHYYMCYNWCMFSYNLEVKREQDTINEQKRRDAEYEARRRSYEKQRVQDKIREEIEYRKRQEEYRRRGW